MSRRSVSDPRPGTTGGPRRVLVYGVTGSGKTTLARRIGEQSGLPWHAVDELTWEPGWVQVAETVQRERIAGICAEEDWILDHAYGVWLDDVMPRVDLVVGLDYPRLLSLGRLLRRTIRRVVTRQETCNGNIETLRTVVAPDSIIRWHFQSYASKRDRIRRWEQDPDAPPVLRFTHPRQVGRWLDTV